jgi:hypothetical protein
MTRPPEIEKAAPARHGFGLQNIELLGSAFDKKHTLATLAPQPRCATPDGFITLGDAVLLALAAASLTGEASLQ